MMQSPVPEKATKREKLLFILRLSVFAVLLTVVLSYALYVLVPKHDYGICSITNLYQQQEDTVDVLVLGTSLAYAGVNTNVLWQEYGISSYNLCGAEQPYWISYHYLQEALKTQTPRLILLDAKATTYKKDYSNRGRAILGTSGIADPAVRLKALRASVAEEDFLSFALGFPQLHSYYEELTVNHFAYPPDNGGRGADWKGFIEADITEVHERPSLVWTDTKVAIHPRQEAYLRKTIELARDKNIPILLIGIPNPDYANDHMYYNSLWAIAEEYALPYINYNDPKLRYGLTYSSCFADWQHLNVKGSVVFSRQLGKDLRAMFDLPDRREEEKYQSFSTCADKWYALYPQYLPTE